ncbi:chromatin-remodeling ATPase INO80 isoform X2 [Coccinella septempunctata]|uniref:chromatin-remodeling ATPase INO80 isoform X2 n=1 Tax=Coccinella septempunctata TaxID=41139 RepID=UPI001D07AB5B|nr:chromatin-remodeling ATPase INO80 isoform X2 [Coccinella septempunctata]
MANSYRKNVDKTFKILPEKPKPCVKRKSAKPLHLARVEKALDVNQFLHSLKVSTEDTSSDSDEANNEELLGFKVADFITPTDYYNFSNVSGDRQWLADILQENTDSPPEEVQYQHILKLHSYQKNLRQGKKNFNDYMYYGAGLVSTVDHYAATEKTIPSPLSKKKRRDETSETPLYPSNMLEDIAEEPCLDLNLENGLDFQTFDEDSSNVQCNFNSSNMSLSSSSTGQQRKKVKKFKDEEAKKKWEDMMTIKRKRVFSNLIKKEVGKQQRSKSNRHKETLLQCKRVAQQCAKVVRQKAVLSARIVKEQQWRMKRLARENIAYWKRSRRLDREVKKRMEREAEEQRKIDHELIEAKRQQRKLNFLITQTELYAHFMSKKLGTASAEEQLRILNQLDEEKNPRLAAIDEYDSEIMKEKAKKNAEEAFLNERTRTKHFDLEANSSFIEDLDPDGEQPQPKIFRGKLKGYQLRGMNWLANLYSQGISGILADEMGLGKTVQSIAFLCHIAEKYAVWGPFLIISPASTLHNWQQEIAKFVPSFKVVPYWGNPNERKILRQFWDQKDIYTKEASFHIVITSYQIVITDIKYFNRIKWQYMILDEAQAIKSTSSMRWKTLLGFSCRNRLLLSGTPIQNSMAELWALLHFIMPTLFDSHEEFNEWFSKDIESHAENKTGIDEKHLSRLHMILKPFMLRRIKKDVENELSDKIEIMVYCPLTTRQKLLYIALKQKIKIEDLIHYSVGGGDAHSVDKNFTSNLMNLVMQFRKVCNHPELFERRDAKSPITPTSVMYHVPRLIYDLNLPELNFLLMQKHFLFTCKYIASAVINESDTIFNFCMDMHLSFNEIYQIFQGNILKRWQHYYYSQNKERLTKFIDDWSSPVDRKPSLNIVCHTSLTDDLTSNLLLRDLIFTRNNCASKVIYGHARHTYFSTSEQNYMDNLGVSQEIDMESSKTDDIQISKFGDSNMKFIKKEYISSELPSFLSSLIPKIQNCNITLYCSSRRAAHAFKRHTDEFSYSSLNFYWTEATGNEANKSPAKYLYPTVYSPIDILKPINGWSNIYIPDKETLVTDAGKLSVLDSLLKKLKKEGHRVLIYSQMTKMIDLLEEYMWHRHHKYMRLDGSSKISERRDMVADFQARTDIFVFLLSTRAGGLGINLTAADTVIFYDSDWNPTVDQQAMDRAHRLGQTKQVTVYRLICKGTIEERILQRAREKSEIQKLVISGGNFKPDTLKPKEVVSLLLDEEELVQKFHKSSAKVEQAVVPKIEPILTVQDAEKRKRIEPPFKTISAAAEPKRLKTHDTNFEDQFLNVDSTPTSPQSVTSNDVLTDDLSDASFFEDNEGSLSSKYTVYNVYGSAVKPRTPARGSSKRGRPRGSRRASTLNRINSGSATSGIFTSGDGNAANSSNAAAENSGAAGMSSPVSTVRRGPGRPRLKPSGPLNTSTRGTYKPRKPTRPLPVPLPSDGTNTTSSTSHLYSSYVFDFPEQPDS